MMFKMDVLSGACLLFPGVPAQVNNRDSLKDRMMLFPGMVLVKKPGHCSAPRTQEFLKSSRKLLNPTVMACAAFIGLR